MPWLQKHWVRWVMATLGVLLLLYGWAFMASARVIYGHVELVPTGLWLAGFWSAGAVLVILPVWSWLGIKVVVSNGAKRRWVRFTGHLSVGFLLLAVAGWLGFFGAVPFWKVVGVGIFGIVAGGFSLWLGKGMDG